MCGRFTLTQSSEAIATAFNAPIPFALEPRYNIAPSQPVLVIVWDGHSPMRQVTHLSWGLIPSWAKDSGASRPMINARAETVADKPSFRAAFRRRRCLIPMDGFYEWQHNKALSKTGKASKQPFYIQPELASSVAFAGIWDHWQSSDGSDLYSCAILTMPANTTMQPVHHRMPVIVTPQHYDAWLDLANTSIEPFMEASGAIALRLTPVSNRVNPPTYDHPDCIQPLS